jgi:hypothetical protein
MIKKNCIDEALAQLIMIHKAIKLNKAGQLTRIRWAQLRDGFIEEVEEMLEDNHRALRG